VPSGLAGTHTFLAAGSTGRAHPPDHLAVTVAATETVTSGTGSAPQTTRMPVRRRRDLLLDPGGGPTRPGTPDGVYTVDRPPA